MSTSMKIQQKADHIMGNSRDLAVQTSLTGNTVYTLPKRIGKRNMVDIVLKIMNEDGPMPMQNMRPVKKTRNAVDQFYDEHEAAYETRGKAPRDLIDQVHAHNNAFPKLNDELDKRRSLAQMRKSGFGRCQLTLRSNPTFSNENLAAKFDSTCPKCIKRKKRNEEQRDRRGSLCKKCREELNRNKEENKNKLQRVTKNKLLKARKQQTRYRSMKPLIICSNKCLQCYLAAETKTVSTYESVDNFSPVPQEVPLPNLTPSANIQEINEKHVLTSKSSHRKRVNKKTPSVKSDVNSRNNPGTETGPSVSSYNSFLSTEHEPMVE